MVGLHILLWVGVYMCVRTNIHMLLTGQEGREPGLHPRTWGQEERVPTSQLCHQMKRGVAECQVTVLVQTWILALTSPHRTVPLASRLTLTNEETEALSGMLA